MNFDRCLAAVVAAVALICTAGCEKLQPPVSSSDQCSPSAASNRELVLSFYRLGLIEHSPREAFDLYASPEMLEHKPDVPEGTRTEVVKYLETLLADLPYAKWEVLRVAAESDLVFLHARFTPQPGAQEYAIADVFRLENCKIVEHWDVVAAPREGQPNPTSRF